MKRLISIAVALSTLSAVSAFAADFPIKAPPLPQISNAYPTSKCGFYYGIAAEGGSGIVNGAPAGTVQVGGDIGGLVGYACPVASIPFFAQFKAEFQNLNAVNAGFALRGPAHFEELFAVQTPLVSWLAGYINLGQNNIPAVVPLLPPGVSTVGQPQNYIGLSITQDDISASFAGGSNKDWLNSFGVRTGLLQNIQGPNGVKAVADVFAEINFQSTPLGCLAIGGGNIGCPKLGDRFLAGIELKM